MTGIETQQEMSVPKGWEITTIGEVTEKFLNGGTPPTKNPKYWEGNIPWTTSSPMTSFYLDRGEYKISKEGLEESSSNLIPKNNVLIATRVGVGKVAINRVDVAINQDLTGLILNKKRITPEFFVWSLLSEKYNQKLKGMSRGTTIKGLIRSELERVSIPLPPLPEQQCIATIITTVDDALEKSRKVTGETEHLKAGLMQELMTKGIGHTEFKEDPVIGNVPKEWAISQLDKFVEIIMGQSPTGDTYNREKQGTPLINGPVEFGIEIPTPIQWTTAPTKICKRGDILFCVRGNTTARINIADQPYCIGRGIAAIRGMRENTNTSFIKFALINRHDQIYQMAVGGGSTFPNLTSKQLSELKLAFPSIKEQNRIVNILSTIDHKLTLQRQRTKHYELLKQGLMNDLLTGKRRVQVT